MKYRFFIIFFIISILPGSAYTYGDKKTHTELTKIAINKSVLVAQEYLKNYLGIINDTDRETVILKIMQGSTNEDLLVRGFNHFYDPLKGGPLENKGGLDDTFLGWPVKGIPNPYWAFTNDKPCECLNPFNDNNCNEFTWKLSDRKIQG
jgi:hypothetical protein